MRTVLITGGTGGMGSSHVRAFHAQGDAVVVAGLNATVGEAMVGELGERSLFVRLDVTDEDDWKAAVHAAQERFGPVSVLINNAGVQNPAVLLEDTESGLWERTFAVNVTGQYLGIRAVTASMRRAGGGVIINVGSSMAYGGTAHFASYVASKWAVRGLTRSAALELAKDGIRVLAVHPGVISTPLVHEPPADGYPALADVFSPEPFAVPRLGRPEEVSDLMLHLASSRAAFMTGSDVVIDGGLLLGPAA
ncbi:SDR family oxidoreductase [Kineosporia mesophila]|uniref:SDR family oxidoreductase n=1 Tax=Kineosporia mesophila TaxID=566012 RepID=A0ABP7ARI4_9ACTN|nr:SDR family NAD(P)-dependent oxidoreductase [Kineosporia mesophila]MCD5349110.1 SDR family oxidoreductase [Kineosporia mesophila]